jgi:hypothetical protein
MGSQSGLDLGPQRARATLEAQRQRPKEPRTRRLVHFWNCPNWAS